MEIREFAQRALLSCDLEEKLRAPREELTDMNPGPAVRIETPGRPGNLQFAPPRTAPGLPAASALRNPSRRGVTHHILANHELQAVEVMAWTLLAFPDAPPEFRRGLCQILRDEQRHTRMHAQRAQQLGVPFGSLPVNCYIWKKALSFTSVLDYLAGLPLVFEGANLDHSWELAQALEAAGDEKSAAILRTIHQDEIEHVRFGIDWLRKLKPKGMSDWDAFVQHLHWPLRAEKARGETFVKEARVAAGLSEEFIRNLEAGE